VALSGEGAEKPDLSSGGCSIASGESATDPTLWTLALLAALVLLYRRQARRRAERAGRQRA
jgi:MYXO-CTERM domain-containing protein